MKKTPFIMFILSILCNVSTSAGIRGKYNYNAFARINILPVSILSDTAPTPSGIPFPEPQVQFTELTSVPFDIKTGILQIICNFTNILTGENLISKHIFLIK